MQQMLKNDTKQVTVDRIQAFELLQSGTFGSEYQAKWELLCNIS